jgi:hypothetical protein
MFGKRKTPSQTSQSIPRPSIDSDGKRRVFGEAVFAGKHGDMLRALGFSVNDEANIIPMTLNSTERYSNLLHGRMLAGRKSKPSCCGRTATTRSDPSSSLPNRCTTASSVSGWSG